MPVEHTFSCEKNKRKREFLMDLFRPSMQKLFVDVAGMSHPRVHFLPTMPFVMLMREYQR